MTEIKDQSVASTDEDSLKFFTYPTLSETMPLRAQGALVPQRAILMEVDLAIGSGSKRSVELTYTRYHDFPVADAGDFHDKMSVLVNDKKHHGKRANDRDKDGNNDPVGTKMSLRGKNLGLIYLVIRLSDSIDWAFFHPDGKNLPPFTMLRSETGRGMFFEGGKFGPNGNHIPATADEPECQYAYFIIDGTKLGNAAFIRRFNIHVDLLERNKNDKIINRVPMIIDPDVRNPGGGGN